MSEKRSRAIRPDFAEAWRLEDLRARFDYHLVITGAEAEVILGWSRDQLKTHHTQHPKRPPRKLVKDNPKGWNHYWLGEVLDVMEERILWELKQREDHRPLSDVQRANRAEAKRRREEQKRVEIAADCWLKHRSTFAVWLAIGRGEDEWPLIQRSAGTLEDLLEGLGTVGDGDEVKWMSLALYLHELADRAARADAGAENVPPVTDGSGAV